MSDTVIKHKVVISIAVSVFWKVFFGKLKAAFKPQPRWNSLDRELKFLGYDEIRAQKERRLTRRKGSFDEFWQKQRLVQFLSGSTVILEVMVVGTETIPDSSGDWKEHFWAPGSARYRPVTTVVVDDKAILDKLERSLEEAHRFIGWQSNGKRWEVTYFGDWIYIPEKKLRKLWTREPNWGINPPAADWSYEAA